MFESNYIYNNLGIDIEVKGDENPYRNIKDKGYERYENHGTEVEIKYNNRIYKFIPNSDRSYILEKGSDNKINLYLQKYGEKPHIKEKFDKHLEEI